jgi:hypothetical protein
VDIRRSRDQVSAAVKRALDEAAIRLALPARRVAFETPLDGEVHGVRHLTDRRARGLTREG